MKDSSTVPLLRDAFGACSIGFTPDLAARVKARPSGIGDPHARKLLSPVLVYSELTPTRVAAVDRERQLKGWSRIRKRALIDGRWAELRNLSRRRTS